MPLISADDPPHQLRAALRAALPWQPAPPSLRRAVERMARPAHPRRLLAASLLFALAAAGSFAVGRATDDRTPVDTVLAGYVRARLAASPMDVVSTDQHTVKPWFTGKLDYSPPVTDLAARGYPLIGGRLDFVGGRRVAALVYARTGHTIDLYVWPAPDDRAQPPTERRLSGYSVVQWTGGGMTYWAISDCEPSALTAFATLLIAAR
jgi:anti-sigma factor RsiW